MKLEIKHRKINEKKTHMETKQHATKKKKTMMKSEEIKNTLRLMTMKI